MSVESHLLLIPFMDMHQAFLKSNLEKVSASWIGPNIESIRVKGYLFLLVILFLLKYGNKKYRKYKNLVFFLNIEKPCSHSRRGWVNEACPSEIQSSNCLLAFHGHDTHWELYSGRSPPVGLVGLRNGGPEAVSISVMGEVWWVTQINKLPSMASTSRSSAS